MGVIGKKTNEEKKNISVIILLYEIFDGEEKFIPVRQVRLRQALGRHLSAVTV